MFKIINIKNMNLLYEENVENEINDILQINEFSKKYNLYLNEKDAKKVVEHKNLILKEYGLIECANITDKIIYEFYDSKYIFQGNYVSSINKIIEIFFLVQQRYYHAFTDEEIVKYLRKLFDEDFHGELMVFLDNVLDKFEELYEKY